MAGCGTVPKKNAGDVPAADKSTVADNRAEASAAATPADTPAIQRKRGWKGEYSVAITSEPPGLTVVVNGIPVGTTPCRVLLPGNEQGFSRQNVSIRVRFIAKNPGEKSQTVEQKFTALDRLPEQLSFSRTGAKRVLPGA